MKNSKKQKLDILILIFFPLFALLLSIILEINLIVSIFIFYGLPAVFLSVKLKSAIKKTIIFSLTVIPLYIGMEAIGSISNIWIVQTIFPFHIFGSTVEGILWSIFMIYFAIMFYEYFLNRHITEKLYTPKFKYLLIFALTFFVFFLVTLFSFPEVLNIPSFYVLVGVFLILIPILYELFTHKKLLKKFFIAGLYFFYFNLIYEFAALKLSWWKFPEDGKFIGWISFAGVSFPFEEFFFFIVISILGLLSYYEFFDDDEE